MTAERHLYLDTSVFVEFLLFGGGIALKASSLKNLYASVLAEIEVCRALDRFRLDKRIAVEGYADKMKEAQFVFRNMNLVPISGAIVEKAKGAFPVALKSLDAIHVASAAWLREAQEADTVFCTIDRQQALAAKALGFDVESEFRPG